MRIDRILLIALIFGMVSFLVPSSMMAQTLPNVDRTKAEMDFELKYLEAQKESLIGRHDKALVILEDLHRQERTQTAVIFSLLKTYDALKNRDQFDKLANVLLRTEDSDPIKINYLIAYFKRNSQHEDALALAIRAVTKFPEEKKYYLDQQSILIDMGRNRDAILIADQILTKFGPSYDNLKNKFELELESGTLDQALSTLKAMQQRSPQNIFLLKIEAEIYLKQNNTEAASQKYQEVLALDPNDTDANLFQVVTSNGKDETAYLKSLQPLIKNTNIPIDAKVKELIPYLKDLSNTTDQNSYGPLLQLVDLLCLTHPEDAKAHALHGDVLMQMGNLQKAIEQYETTIKLDPKVYLVWEQLLYAYYHSRQFDKLNLTAEKALMRFPNQIIIYHFAAIAKIQSKEYAKGINIVEDGLLFATGSDEYKSLLFADQAMLFLGMGKLEEALQAATTANNLSQGKNPMAFEALGDYYAKKANKNEAQKNWSKSLSLNPNNPDLQLKLAQ